MSYLQVKKDIIRGKCGAVYFMFGTQSFLMEDIVQHVVRQTFGENEDANVITYHLQETLLDTVVEEAETVSFFGGKKVIIVKDFLIASTAKQDSKLEHDVKRLEKYVQSPSPDTVLILLCPYEKLDARKKIMKVLKEHTVVVDCLPFDERTIIQWLDEQAKEKSIIFLPQAKEALLERAGTELLLLASEVEKLSLYVGVGGEVDVATISTLVSRSLDQDVFALIDSGLNKRIDEALSIYHDLIKQREEPLKLLALIARQLRIYYQVKELGRRSYSQQQIATQLKLHPYVVKLAAQKVHQFEDKKLLSLLEEAANTDYAIKSGKMDKVFAVEMLLLKLNE